MRKLHLALIIFTALCLLITICWGVVWNYANLQTVPPNVTAGAVAIGGLKIEEARHLLSQQQVQQNSFSADDFEIVIQALEELKEGSIWERAAYRFNFPVHFDLNSAATK